MTPSGPVAGLVLAAGEGRRFGGPKALAVLDGERLVDRAVTLLARAGLTPVVVVSGAIELTVPGATVVPNPLWPSGMGRRTAEAPPLLRRHRLAPPRSTRPGWPRRPSGASSSRARVRRPRSRRTTPWPPGAAGGSIWSGVAGQAGLLLPRRPGLHAPGAGARGRLHRLGQPARRGPPGGPAVRLRRRLAQRVELGRASSVATAATAPLTNASASGSSAVGCRTTPGTGSRQVPDRGRDASRGAADPPKPPGSRSQRTCSAATRSAAPGPLAAMRVVTKGRGARPAAAARGSTSARADRSCSWVDQSRIGPSRSSPMTASDFGPTEPPYSCGGGLAGQSARHRQ